MFSNLFLKSFRILLLPFSLIYWLGITVRNWLYNAGIKHSTSFGLPLICVGNLSVGGTGKSPMVEYLVYLLKGKFKVATLSRGYKRRTKGYVLATAATTALEIGDEPMQFHQKFPNVPVAVGEKRIEAIPQLLHDHPAIETIILDDAFQHRSVKAGMNILLTDYNNLFTRDFYLPTGDLRDLKRNYKRADIIVVTKCDPGISDEMKKKITEEINPLSHQQIFFAANKYASPYHILNKETILIDEQTEVLLVSGVANPTPLKKWLEINSAGYTMLPYSDHHIFSIIDLNEIKKKFATMQSSKRVILTTEKDAVRLLKFADDITALPIYVLPVRHQFLFNEEAKFNDQVIEFIQNFKP